MVLTSRSNTMSTERLGHKKECSLHLAVRKEQMYFRILCLEPIRNMTVLRLSDYERVKSHVILMSCQFKENAFIGF